MKGGGDLRLAELQKGIDMSAGLSQLLEFFQTKNFNVFWVNLALPVFRDLGIFVGKVISPQLHQLYLDERYPYYGGRRLYELPVELGYLKKPLREGELNPLPHPFP